MNLWSRFNSCLRGTLLRSGMETEMDAELRFHIEACADDLIRSSGVSRQEAMRQARLQFGWPVTSPRAERCGWTR